MTMNLIGSLLVAFLFIVIGAHRFLFMKDIAEKMALKEAQQPWLANYFRSKLFILSNEIGGLAAFAVGTAIFLWTIAKKFNL